MHASLHSHKYTYGSFPLHDVVMVSPFIFFVRHILRGKLSGTFWPCSDGELQVVSGGTVNQDESKKCVKSFTNLSAITTVCFLTTKTAGMGMLDQKHNMIWMN